MERIEKSLYFDKNALGVLLDSKGCSSLDCLDIFGKNVEISANEAYGSLYMMLGEGVIGIEDEKFTLSPETDEVITTLSSAQKALVIYGKDISPSAVYKKDDSYIMSSQCDMRRGRLKLTVMSRGEVIDFFVDTVSAYEKAKDMGDNMYYDSLLLYDFGDDFSSVAAADGTLLMLDFISLPDKESITKAVLTTHNNSIVLIVWDGKGVKVHPYDKVFIKTFVSEKF